MRPGSTYVSREKKCCATLQGRNRRPGAPDLRGREDTEPALSMLVMSTNKVVLALQICLHQPFGRRLVLLEVILLLVGCAGRP